MSAIPKLPQTERERIAALENRRRTLTKLIAVLKDEKRAIPSNSELARKLGVSYKVVRRAALRDFYKTPHPQDAA